MKTLSLLALLLTVLPAVARADDNADEAEFRFRHGAELYLKGKYEEALTDFFASNRLVHNKNVRFNIARCFEQLGKYDEAFRFYNDLRGESWSEAERQALETAIAKLSPRVALVTVRTTPAGADIYVDRKDLGSHGTSPRTVALPPGPAKIIVELDGYRPVTREVQLAKGGEAVVDLPLERIWGHVKIDSVPSGAEVREESDESAVVCTTPCERKVLPGVHAHYFVTKVGRVPGKVSTTVGPDQTVQLEAMLPPLPPPKGTLVVTANKDGALVKLDGVESGFTPVVIDPVVAGPHVVTVSMEDYETFTTKVVVVPHKSSAVRARLSVPSPKVTAAAKTPTSSEDAPASVTVITSDELRAFGYRTLAEALKAVRGMFVTNDGIYQEIGIRGFQPAGDLNTRILLLVDGHPANDVWAGQAGVGTDFDTDLSQVERIEVVRGPASALYGSAAVFGVINVVHRTAPRFGHVELYAAGGDLGSAKARVTAGFDHGGSSAMVSASGLDVAGPVTTTLTPAEGAAPTVVHGNGQESARHVTAIARDGELRFVASFNDRFKRSPVGSWGTDPTGDTHTRDIRGFAEGNWDHALASGGTFSARAYFDWSRYTARYAYDPSSEDSAGANWAGAELRLRTGPLLGNNRLTVGAEYQRWLNVFERNFTATTTNAADAHAADIVNGYAMDEWKLAEHTTLQAGLGFRLQRITAASAGASAPAPEANVSPSLAFVARPYDGGLTKVLFGRAFRSANVYELYYNDGGESELPAGTLAPEEIYTGEVEHSHRLSDEVTATVDVFGNRLTNVIHYVDASDADHPARVRFANDPATIWAFGGEAEVRWQPSRLELVSFSYSYQYSRDPELKNELPLLNSPAHLASLRGMFPIVPGLTVAGEATYGSPRLASDGSMIGEALLVSVVLSGELPKYGLQYSLAAYNLLDQHYDYPAAPGNLSPFVPQAGRTVQLSLAKAF